MRARNPRDRTAGSFRWRAWLILALLLAAGAGLLAQAAHLQLYRHDFYTSEGNERFSRVATITAHRGMITDRNGEPLAISTPVDSVWVNPQELAPVPEQIPRLAKALKLDRQELAQRITSNEDRQFLYVARHLPPVEAEKIRDLGISGVYLKREYRRYYPSGEVTGQMLGFTNVDDAGQEGLELAFDHWLAGTDGAKRVIQDGFQRVVQNVDSIREVSPGHDLRLSIDLRLQYLAYRELKAAVRDQNAKAGTMVVLDVKTGEILAMVNQPGFNPNDREQADPADYRNRAVTDILEAGSTIKPFFVAAAIQSGRYDDHSIIDTAPGEIKVGATIFPDEHPLGRIDIATILAKSSNVGMIHLALSLPPELIWTTLSQLGLGQVTASGFPGESAGVLSNYAHWRPIGIATMSHGYGLSVTPLQLAQGYATFGAMGVRRPVSFLPVTTAPEGERVLTEHTCRELVAMLETVVAAEGTGTKAAIYGYRVAGKTGTAEKATDGGYSKSLFMSVFAGVAPASDPRLAAVVVIDTPSAGLHRGGDVAAPVFSAVMGPALRLLGVAPDTTPGVPADEAPAPLPAHPHPGTHTVARR
ncbi:MAG TPA: penicillin-binding transpeptidase domain-containing protein [Steroidobacteraceae bacterium]|jgi:cell division protein FtsI (penicillin-binding protein 3)|nr:penicillin-binding transpeptidase domain-containing protein [Steroidobacteraceae bacterium]